MKTLTAQVLIELRPLVCSKNNWRSLAAEVIHRNDDRVGWSLIGHSPLVQVPSGLELCLEPTIATLHILLNRLFEI